MSHDPHSDTVPLHSTSQSDIDEIENLINSQPYPSTVLPARPPSPPRASIPISSSPLPAPVPPVSTLPKPVSVPPAIAPVTSLPPLPPSSTRSNGGSNPIASAGFGPAPNTLTEPVWDTVKRDLSRIVSNLKLVVFPNPFREDPGKALRDWDLWGPFFFIVFLGLVLSWSASVKKVFSFICLRILVLLAIRLILSLPFSVYFNLPRITNEWPFIFHSVSVYSKN